MHELSLSEALFDQIDFAISAHAKAVVRLVRVRVGELAGLEPELFRTAFEVTRSDRGHARAELELVYEAAMWMCGDCQAELVRGEELRCAVCGGQARLSKGADLILERVEMEVPDV